MNEIALTSPGLDSTGRLLCLVELLTAGQLSAAEIRPTRKLPTPPANAASVATSPPATDAGSPKLANGAGGNS